MKLVAGSSNPVLAQALAQELGLELTLTELSHFGNGEKQVWIKESVRGENVILLQSFQSDNDIMEFLLLADALERMGARHVNAVVPWLAYSRQDKVFREGEPIAAKVVANLISTAYIKRAFLLDLHNSSIPGFFAIPTQHISAMELFAEHVENHFELSNFVVASPDFGGLKRARVFATRLNLPLVNIDKQRDLHTGQVQAMGVSGEVEGKSVFLFDDMIDSGGTVITTTEILKKHGAKQVHFLATHGPLVATAFPKIESSLIDSVIVTDSIAQLGTSPKVSVLSVAPLFKAALNAWRKSPTVEV